MIAGTIASDIDHPGASAAKMWGPVSTIIAHAVSVLTGGHRGLTHGRWPGPSILITWTVLVVSVVSATAYVTGAPFVTAATLVLAAAVKSAPALAAFVWAFTAGVALTAIDRVSDGRRSVPWVLNLAMSTVVGFVAWKYHWNPVALLPGFAVGVAFHLFGDKFRDDTRLARGVVAVSCAAALAVAAWVFYSHIGGTA